MPPEKNIVNVIRNRITRRGLNSRRDNANAAGIVTSMFRAVPATE
ncbi:hypothetical protein BIFLH23_00736 [Bifidobacterium longum subsp. infantis]|uniref:Uncharacterized protein n=1 Tax=Bifidobacterium longum subsp. infantis TaxID=1682 RepID=A0A8U0L7A8_BIFLI|nr:hypothetical protein BIFLH23_00736 [Bifidobacterium longum subsp. infantis]